MARSLNIFAFHFIVLPDVISHHHAAKNLPWQYVLVAVK
jgi:hypothetical protein